MNGFGKSLWTNGQGGHLLPSHLRQSPQPFDFSDLTSQLKFLGQLRVFKLKGLNSVTPSAAVLAMPGVNLDFLPASQAPEALGSPDSACAESGLEEVIGDLLAQEEAEDEEEQFCKGTFELTLQCAVGEVHSDLQAFGKRVDARLEEAAAQVAPLAEVLARLQEENLRLRIQQERLVRQVETLCQVMGLPDPLLHVLPSKESSPSTPSETKTQFSDSPTSSSDPPASTPQDTAHEAPHDSSPCTPQDSPSSAPQDTPTSTLLNNQSSVSQEPISCPQDSDPVSTGTSTPQNSEPSPVPHPPTFATRRSLSAPSVMADISCNNSTVLVMTPFNSDKLLEEWECLLFQC